MALWLSALSIGGAAAQPISFDPMFSDSMVLQREPAKAAVYGSLAGSAEVTVTVNDGRGPAYNVTATSWGTRWKALLRPGEAGGSVSITATCTGGVCEGLSVAERSASIGDATFGDVWYCAGQSNMWLPLRYTFSRNSTVTALRSGKYDNIRLMAGDSQKSTAYAWMTARNATQGQCDGMPVPSGASECPLLSFSAACYYFAEALTDRFAGAGVTTPTIGLIGTAIGGSMIEEWVPNVTTGMCGATNTAAHNQELWDKNVVPYLNTSVKGWLWYQGENNMHSVMGNSAKNTGYGCQMWHLIQQWRSAWSSVPGTTDPEAPFGLVTLAAGTDEGGKDMGDMRWSQTANYGVVPNTLMPNTFLAQAYDLAEPWDGLDHCVKSKLCCRSNNHQGDRCASKPCSTTIDWGRNHSTCPDTEWDKCKAYCTGADSPVDTTPFMGGIHPRAKRPVGERLAQAAGSVVYGLAGPATGPTIAGCTQQAATIAVRFNTTLLKGDKVEVGPYGPPKVSGTAATTTSSMRVLVNASYWCASTRMNTTGKEPKVYCADENAPNGGECGGPMVCGADELAPPRIDSRSALVSSPEPWVEVDILPGLSPNEITLDLAKLNGSAPLAVRYAWGNEQGKCCVKDSGLEAALYPCPLASCPLKSKAARLPANPFMAALSRGRCKCMSPQVCDE